MTNRTPGETSTVDSLALVNGRVVTPDSVLDGGVRFEGNRIVSVGDIDTDVDVFISVEGRYVLPGLVDLHGDDIETHLYPRSGARMSTPMALAAADRANLAAGITTKFHAISFVLDESENRSPELAAELTNAISAAEGLLADHRLHARCEVTQKHSVDAVMSVLDDGDADLVSVMSHIPGKGQFRDIEAFREYYSEASNHTLEEADRIIETRGAVSMKTVRDRVNCVIERAQEAGVVTASHDDEGPEAIAKLADTGIDITEYPLTLETAIEATELGIHTVMGAPNLIQGESQWGNLRTADAIEAGVVDTLVADYHPPSLLASVFVDTGESLPERVGRVTQKPADAVGLSDRGRLVAGNRADVIVVDSEPTPTVTQAIVGGRPTYWADPEAGRPQ